MNRSVIRGNLTIVCTAVLAMLAACGGGDPAGTATANDDATSMPWNATASVDVTGNDTTANGTATLTIATAPAHGTATIEGTKIRYTPAAGYFGTDTLRYTLKVGNATSTASLHVAVEAHLKLQGTAVDAPLSGAKVVATVGGVAQPAVTADADGHYSVDIVTADPAAFIALKATGAGAQSKLVLASLVGDASVAAAAAAKTTGIVDAAALPAMNLTEVTTATAALANQVLGKAPASSADLATAQGRLVTAKVVEMAAAIKLVADRNAALPQGIADTLALVSNTAAYKAFIIQEASVDPRGLSLMTSVLTSDPAIAASPPVPAAGGADVQLLLTEGLGAAASGASRITLKADGTATVMGAAAHPAHWKIDGSQLLVTYDKPIDSHGQTLDDTGIDRDVVWHGLGLKVRQLAGAGGSGPAAVGAVSTFTWVDGPKAGQTQPNDDIWAAETLLGSPLGFTANYLAAGTEWAGVIVPAYDGNLYYAPPQDTLKLVDGHNFVFERTGTRGTYAIVDGTLILTSPSGAISYTRQSVGINGEDHWIAEKRVADTSGWILDAAVVKATPGLSFTTASAAHDWESAYIPGLLTDVTHFVLRADGTGERAFESLPGVFDADATPLTWRLGEDGTASSTRTWCDDGTLSCGLYQTRTWKLVATSGKTIFVMEDLDSRLVGGDEAFRLMAYTNSDQ